MDRPLAFCDSRSVTAAELRTLPVHNYAGGGFFFETLAVVAPRDPSAHHWYVFPEMGRDEVVVFRTFESERAARGETFWTPHSAFADPAEPAQHRNARDVPVLVSAVGCAVE